MQGSVLATAWRRLVIPLAGLAVCGTAFIAADVITLKNGERLQGTVESYGERVMIRQRNDEGLIGISSTKVARVQYGVWLSDVDASTNPVMYAQESSDTNVDDGSTIYGTGESMLSPNVVGSDLAKKAQEIPQVVVVIIGMGTVVWLLIAFIASIVLLVDAFKHSVVWGILCFLFNPLLLVHLFVNYEGRKFILLLLLFSPMVWIALCILAVLPYLR